MTATRDSLFAAFAAQARRTPSADAVADGELRLSYAQLEEASAGIAAALAARGVRPGQAVAVCLPRSWQLVALMLGVLRAGAVLVPVDADSPADRMAGILADCGCAAFIHGGSRPALTLPAGAWSMDAGTLLALGQAAERGGDIPRDADDGGYCMLFYTSGTTGQPKGVRVRAEGVLRLCKPGYIGMRPGDRYASISNPAFDAISFEVWVPLVTGGCCVVLRGDDLQDARRFAAKLQAERIDTLFITVALFNAVVDQEPHCFAHARQVLVGGEQLDAEAVKAWYRANPDAPTQLWNAYGPTECTTFALAWPIPRGFDGAVVPIGTPLADTEVHLVAEGSRLAGEGEVAELHLGGAGVAAGYHGLPELTAGRFVRLPWLDGGRAVYYRTGDLARRNAAGLVEYVGRTDRQVKVRGFRIEPGEVEQRILRHPAVRHAHVCTRRGADGHHELLAFLVVDAALGYEDFDAHLRATLPHYMRPHRLFRVDAFPRTPNGKLHAQRLLDEAPAPWRRPAGQGAAKPSDPWQREVLELAQQVLAHPGLRPGDDFVGSGGDSLKALQFHFAAQRQWRHDLPVAAILREPFSALAERLARAEHGQGSAYPPVPARTEADRGLATAEQQRLWLLQQQAPQSTAYNVPLAFRLQGPVDGGALARALALLVDRHPALRTAFAPGADSLQQVVSPAPPEVCRCHPPGRFNEVNWRAFAELVFGAPFDLAAPRLFQAHWLPFADGGGGMLLLHLHHTVVDGWSLNLLLQDIGVLYAACAGGSAPPEAPQALTPLEFAPWQAAWFRQPDYARRRAAMAELHRAQGAMAPALEPKRPEAGSAARLLRVPLDLACRAGLDHLCAQLRLTRFEVLLSVFSWILLAATGRERLRIASPVANRPVAEFETAVGMFANTVLVPIAIEETGDLRAQLRQQAATVQAVLDLQDVALADAVADLHLSAQPAGSLFDFMFVLENTDYGRLQLPGVQPSLCLPAQVHAKCPLTLSVVDGDAGLDCVWEAQCSYFDAHDVEAMANLFRRGLELLLSERPASLADLVVPHRQQLPELGAGPVAPIGFATIADWFEHQARCTPDAPALHEVHGRTVSYAQLDRLADTLAMELHAVHPVPPAARQGEPLHVALYLDASVEHVVSLLALAKLNLTAVPLDTSYPPALLRQVLEQARPLCVLLRDGAQEALDALDGGRFARHVVTLAARGDAAPPPIQRGVRPLYTLFTSGSTGAPKGVRVMDHTLCNLLHWQRTHGGLAPAAATLQFSALSFDVAFQELFTTLCGGGAYHLLPPGWRQDPQALLHHMAEAGIARIFMPYVALQFVAETGVARGLYPDSLRDVVTAGEQLLCTEPVRRWFAGMPRAVLHNHYGPTETHVVSAYRLAGPAAQWPVRPPIGSGVSNARLRVVDAQGRALPPGCAGQLLIGGPMAWRCYLDDARLNAERFAELDGALWYRTGDLARFGHDGQLHFLGRDDQQIKLSGHRLELGQIEAALMRHPAVTTAIVAGEGEPASLVAYLQAADGSQLSAADLDRHLAQHLPGHVRVGAYRQLAQWPRTPSGKIDRRALPRAQWRALAQPPAAAQAQPGSALEQSLADIFAAVVGRPIGADQTFFEAGATSLDLIRFHLRCRSELDAELGMPALFEHVTVRRLARHLEGAQPDTAPAPAQAAAAGQGDGRIAVIGMALKVPGANDLGAFWDMVVRGGSGVEHFTPADDGLVGARSQLQGPFDFDPAYFGISRREAQLMDPQQRHLLMGCVHALQHAGIDPARTGQRIGVVASCGEATYFQDLLRHADPDALPDGFQMALHHDKDFLATKIAFHLDLKGPAVSVQAACGSSLIAVHMAGAMLRQDDSDVMLAGGVLVDPQLAGGYRWRPQHIFSKDGDCRPFSDDASGTIGASGWGVVVLKPLEAAERDGDRIYAVVEGSALNNDGAAKLGYTAPSLAGQGEVIRAALRRAGLDGADVGYVEAHGTGTPLGDPVEVAALAKAFGPGAPDSCALASVKSQIGHLGAAAGVVGLIRAALALHHGTVPPNVNFRALNPQIALEGTPFYIPTQARPWPTGRRRIAGVSSFGIGGTNAHLVLGEAPVQPAEEVEAQPCLLLSAHSESALRADLAAVADYLEAHPGHYGAVLRHLRTALPRQRWRFGAVCRTAGEAVAALRAATVREVPWRDGSVEGEGLAPDAVVAAWLDGSAIRWREAEAPAPWDFPPAAFDLAPYRLETRQPAGAAQGTPAFPARQPFAQWFHRLAWSRLTASPVRLEHGVRDTLVLLTAGGDAEALLDAARPGYRRVVRVDAGDAYRRINDNRFELDPCDAPSVGALLAALDAEGAASIDWLHALPLSVAGEVGEASLLRAQWACVDSVAALMQAWGRGARTASLRLWLLSHGNAPVDGPVPRPELGALAGAFAVVPQEYAVDCRWLDLQSPSWAGQAGAVAALLASPPPAGARLAMREGALWQAEVAGCELRADAPADPALLPGDAVVLVIGGSGGIGAALARHLLEAPDRRVVVLSRRPRLPDALRQHADRIALVAGDIGDPEAWPALAEQLRQLHPRIDGIVHAAGSGVGSLIQTRSAQPAAGADPAKTLGMAVVEMLVARFAPRFVLYCASMSGLLGGAGQFDYAAANGVLDGFAHYRPEGGRDCVRMAIDWDIWREAGMAVSADLSDARHQAHLAVGLSNAEGARVFDQALRLQLPQLLVSTTGVEASRRFYPALPRRTPTPTPAAPPASVAAPQPGLSLAAHLRERMGAWLGVPEIDTAASLYDLGADSLTLLDLIGELQERFQLTLQLSQFGPEVSLDDVVALAEAARAPAVPAASPALPDAVPDDVPIEVWREGTGTELLCLVHPVGGDVQAYRELVAALDPELRVCVIADPLLADPALPPLELRERAARYLRALERRHPRESFRWQLAGWSFGAAVACAMCALAEEEGEPVAQLHLIDPPMPASAGAPPALTDAELEAVFRRELLAHRQPEAGMPTANANAEGAAGAQDYARRLARCCRLNMASLAQFQPARLARTPVQVFVATRQDADALAVPVPQASARAAWRALLPHLAGWHALDADHYGIVKGASARWMAQAISRNAAPVFA